MSLFINPRPPSTMLALGVYMLTTLYILFSEAALVCGPASIHLYGMLPYVGCMPLTGHFLFALIPSPSPLLLLHSFNM